MRVIDEANSGHVVHCDMSEMITLSPGARP